MHDLFVYSLIIEPMKPVKLSSGYMYRIQWTTGEIQFLPLER